MSEEDLDRLLEKLRERRGLDFHDYRRSFIRRHVENRMFSLGLQGGDCRKYEELIAKSPVELDILFDKLTINVTEFFRDPDVWEYLAEHIFNPLLSKAREPAFIWSAGCAAGEEPYTIAIIIHEMLRLMNDKPTVRIVASDVDPISLARAKAGRYGEASLKNVSERRLKIFFSRHEGYVQVVPEIASMVQFVEHSYLDPPPGRRIHVITCRNSMIYLTKGAREKALHNFHKVLVPGGTLVLGASEVLIGDSHQGMFETMHSQSSVFKNLAG